MGFEWGTRNMGGRNGGKNGHVRDAVGVGTWRGENWAYERWGFVKLRAWVLCVISELVS